MVTTEKLFVEGEGEGEGDGICVCKRVGGARVLIIVDLG